MMEGAIEKISALRSRYARVKGSLAYYEAKVARQARELERMNRPSDWDGESDDEDPNGHFPPVGEEPETTVTQEDLRLEEEEVKELERRKRELEDRVTGMEKDLGGLLRG